jgi:indole-3-glycerol phosphate synthase
MTASSGFLEAMAASSRERVVAAKRSCSEGALLDQALATLQPLPLLRSPAAFDLIAELKLRSPAMGRLKPSGEDVAERVTMYARAGAAAVSVLTEPSRFDGSMTHLELAAGALRPLGVPAMRKDFLVDPYQVIEARAAGAGGVLVILRMLSRAEIEVLLDSARMLGLFVLLEAFDEDDIEIMHEIVTVRADQRTSTDSGAPLLAGLNCRDLTTLQIVPERLEELARLLPLNVPRVAESGVLTPADAGRMAAAGYEYALVGSALMQGADPRSLATQMLEAGRARKPR